MTKSVSSPRTMLRLQKTMTPKSVFGNPIRQHGKMKISTNYTNLWVGPEWCRLMSLGQSDSFKRGSNFRNYAKKGSHIYGSSKDSVFAYIVGPERPILFIF